MELALYGALFAGSAGLLYLSGGWVVHGLTRISRTLGVREFVVAFFVMATAASLPNLFVGVASAVRGIPELSLGDVFGNNLVAMTLAVAAGVFFSRGRSIAVEGSTIRTSLFFTFAAACLPILLIFDGTLGRVDALLLLALFFAYVRWIFSKRERFSRAYNHEPAQNPLHHLGHALKHFFKVFAGVALLLCGSLGIVFSASFFAGYFGVPLIMVGVFVVGLGGALPEIYFSIFSARRGETALIMGNIMGSVIIQATLVLGLVALIHPISVGGLQFLAGARAFLLLAAALFFIFAMTRHRISRPEAAILALVYFAFILWAALAA